ncbi:IS3 family transposase [Paraburkholderia sediminicola]|uniref:IS3 family transposase n=2 Tax=Paraburkholderia TaxID=1822464 RepID=UPI0038B7C070
MDGYGVGRRGVRDEAERHARIRAIHVAFAARMGCLAPYRTLREGMHVGRKPVARLMRLAGLCDVSRRRWISNTRRIPTHGPRGLGGLPGHTKLSICLNLRHPS